MKFDLIISNPPYNKGIDLKILESILDLSERICFVHPSTWLYDTFNYTKSKELKEKLKGNVKSIELLDGNKIFNIGLFMPVSLSFFEKSKNVAIKDRSKFFVKSEQVELQEHLQIFPFFSGVNNKIFNFLKLQTNPFVKDNNVKFGVANIRGHVASNDYFTIVQKDIQKHVDHKYEFGWNVKEDEYYNLFSYLKLKITRYILSLYKLHQAQGYYLKYLPWFDFSRSWTDEECAAELGITDEELLWMIQQIPDYYPEDATVYRALEEKLKTKQHETI